MTQAITSPITVSAEGGNYLEYRSADLAGNVEDTRHAMIQIDSVAPSLTTDCVTGFKSTSATVAVLATFSDEASGVSSIKWRLDDGEWMSMDTPGPATELVLEDLTDSAHTLTITVTDVAGHETSATLNFEVETSLFALDGPAGPWIVVGMLLAIVAVIAVASALLFRRTKVPKA